MSPRPSLVPSDPSRTWRLRDPLIALILFLTTAAVTLWHNAHIAILWDLSYLLDSSYRIALGQIPYRDFPFAHAPLTFLLQAAIIKLTGRVYFHHIVYAALAGATATVLTQRVLFPLIGNQLKHPRLIANLLAVPVVVLGIYSIYPHPIYDSDCILAVLLAVYLLQRVTPANPFRSLLTGAALVPPLFFKQNIGLIFLASSIAAVIAIAIANRLQRKSIRSEIWIATGAAATLVLALVAIQFTAGLHNYVYWTLTFAAQRRLPGLGTIVTIYHQTSLLWTIPAAITGLVLLKAKSRAAKIPALLLLAAPFLWTLVTLPFLEDSSDRADQLLSLWPHLLLLAIAVALYSLYRDLRSQQINLATFLPLILLATIHGTFLSQQLWGSTYAIWPLLILLVAGLLIAAREIALPLAAIIAITLTICGASYALSHERLSYNQLSGSLTHSTLPELRGLTTPGPYIPAFEELIRDTNRTVPTQDAILLFPGQDPFYFATGRTPLFPVLLFDPATNPYSPAQLVDQVAGHNVRWLIVNRTLQLTEPPIPNYNDYLAALQPVFILDHTLQNYDIYRRR